MLIFFSLLLALFSISFGSGSFFFVKEFFFFLPSESSSCASPRRRRSTLETASVCWASERSSSFTLYVHKFFFFSSFLQRVRLYFFSVCWLLRRESDLFSLQLRHKNIFFLPWYIKCLSWSIAEDSEQWRIPLFFWSIISLHFVVPFLSSSSHSFERRFPRVECVKLTQK